MVIGYYYDYSARADIGMSGCNVGIHVFIGLLNGIIEA